MRIKLVSIFFFFRLVHSKVGIFKQGSKIFPILWKNTNSDASCRDNCGISYFHRFRQNLIDFLRHDANIILVNILKQNSKLVSSNSSDSITLPQAFFEAVCNQL